ncbi:MAG TPA: hypothetical protein VGG46_11690 [Terriglobales bacterium]|jgi:hypothetical protein
MATTFEPWVKNSALTAERLSLIATGLREVRDDALNSYEPLKGETVWTLGSSKYERSKHKIKQMALENPSWFSLIPDGSPMRCTFGIEGIPIRYYHQVPEFDPPQKYTVATEGERMHHQLLFEADGVPFRYMLFRLAIVDDRMGKVSSVTLVEFDDTATSTNEYLIPFDLAPSKIIPIQSPVVNLERVTVQPLESEQPASRNENEKNDKSGTAAK